MTGDSPENSESPEKMTGDSPERLKLPETYNTRRIFRSVIVLWLYFELNGVVESRLVATGVIGGGAPISPAHSRTLRTEFNFEFGSTEKWVDGKWIRPEEQRTAGSIVSVGLKVEVSFEEAGLPGVWFPATVVEELGNNLFLVEYQCLGFSNEPELRKVTVDHLHICPSTPPLTRTNFVLLEKVDAFYDFGWWTGVITKKLADSRYIVYFKHTNKEREVGHLELRLHVEHGESSSVKHSNNVERATVLLNFTGPVEDTTPGIEKQTSIVATTMKRTKVTSAGTSDKPLKPSKKLKPGITFDDQTLSDVGPSTEVSNPTAGQSGKTFDKTENLSRRKRMTAKVGLKSSMITSARKKGRSVADSKGVKALPQGGTGDLIKIKTPKIVEKEHVTRELLPPVTCVMGLPCKALTIVQTKKVKSPSINPPKIVESETPQSGAVPLASKTTGGQDPNLVPDDGKEADGGTVLKRKRGRPFKTKPKTPKTPLAVNHENGDAGEEIVAHEKNQLQITGSPDGPQPKNTPVVNEEKLPKKSSGNASTVLLKTQSVKGKRGKRRKIRSINVVTPAQGVQESSSKQKENGGLENESSEVPAEKSPDTMSDDQPLSRWFEGMQQHHPITTFKKQMENMKSPSTVTNGGDLSFEKRSTLWATLESMELFQMVPQRPHFRPLDNEKECTREGHAISKMVTYLRVVEATSQLKLENPRSVFEENLEALVELESHGFDVKPVRDRLTGLLLIKEKQEGLEEESRKVKDKMELERVEGQRLDKEIELVDKQVVALLEKRAQVLKKKENKDKEVVALEAEVEGINEGLSEVRCRFDGLAAASLCVSDQETPPGLM